ncbi:MAG: multiheme c-type cytochrome [Bryobacteraceae bacterium]
MNSRAAMCVCGFFAVLTHHALAQDQPSKGEGSVRDQFRGVRNCATCHPAQAGTHPSTSMAHAMETIAECDILRKHPVLTAQLGPYSYRIERRGDRSMYTVTDGVQTFSMALGWAFGLGSAGQTYVFEKDGVMYESRVSYYRVPDSLDMTMGAQKLHPTNILEAAGRYMGPREAALCFGCHSTNGASNGQVTLETMIPGVQCERCHGPTENHLKGLKTGDSAMFAMKKLSSLNTEEISNFCGQCHRTWQEIAMNGPHGTANVRFQPYRLTNSKCYDADDKRISCLACHDPHREVDYNDLDYDAKCQACHGGGKPEAKACKVATKACVSCHMIKIELPGGHHKFTDHDIRIASVNGAYPD